MMSFDLTRKDTNNSEYLVVKYQNFDHLDKHQQLADLYFH